MLEDVFKKRMLSALFRPGHAGSFRRDRGRLLGGVLAALGDLIGVDVILVRVTYATVFAGLCLLAPSRALLLVAVYVVLWIATEDATGHIPLEQALLRLPTLLFVPVVTISGLGLVALVLAFVLGHPTVTIGYVVLVCLLGGGVIALSVWARDRHARIHPTGLTREPPLPPREPADEEAETDAPTAELTVAYEIAPEPETAELTATHEEPAEEAAFSPAMTGENAASVAPALSTAPPPALPSPRPRPRRQGPGRRLGLLTAAAATLVLVAAVLYGLSHPLVTPLLIPSAVGLVFALGALASHLMGRNGGWMTGLATLLIVCVNLPVAVAYSLTPAEVSMSATGATSSLLSIPGPAGVSSTGAALTGSSTVYADPGSGHDFTRSIMFGSLTVYVPSGTPVTVDATLGAGSMSIDFLHAVSSTGDLALSDVAPDQIDTIDTAALGTPSRAVYAARNDYGFDAEGHALDAATISTFADPSLVRGAQSLHTTVSFPGEGEPVHVKASVGHGRLRIIESTPHWGGTVATIDGEDYMFATYSCTQPYDCTYATPLPGMTTWGTPYSLESDTMLNPVTRDADGRTISLESTPNPFIARHDDKGNAIQKAGVITRQAGQRGGELFNAPL